MVFMCSQMMRLDHIHVSSLLQGGKSTQPQDMFAKLCDQIEGYHIGMELDCCNDSDR